MSLPASRGSALLLVLAMVVLVSLLLVAFVSAMRFERIAAASYSQSMDAAEIARGGINLIVTGLQSEMAKDALPDTTYTNNPLYTNVSSSNILPQKNVTNSALPNLVKISTNAAFFTGTLTNSQLVAATNSSSTPSLNGRSVDTNRWNEPYLGSFTNNANTPAWIFVTRSGVTNGTGATFSGTNAINNPSPANTNYAIGRFAYAVYDVGGLLDITVAGYPSNSLTAAQLQIIKGTLAGADVTAVGITNPTTLTSWRNQTTASNATTYLAYITNFAATNGFLSVAQGDTTFLSRQDLIQAAKNGIAGLNTNMLTNLTVFTRERNAPSWRPLATINTPTNCTIDYATLATNAASTNPFIPLIRYTASNTITSYQIDGTSYTYNVVPGDPLVYHRFPLDRIKWLGSNGATNGGTAASIQACFGLKWSSATDVWQYVGSTGNTEQSSIKTLSQVLAEATPREPNFFELLQAGILSGSLAKDGDAPPIVPNSTRFLTLAQQKYPFHVFRIGANILTQYQTNNYPVVVEYSPVAGDPWQACGAANIPYVSAFRVLGGTVPGNANSIETFLVFSLWNPHQQGATAPSRPPIRIGIQGSIAVYNNYYSGGGGGYNGVAGYTTTIPTSYVNLSTNTTSNGVNGFADQSVPVATDLSANPGAGTSAGNSWVLMPSVDATALSYLGYRLPDFPYSTNATSTNITALNASTWQWLLVAPGASAANPFDYWLEYQTPGGVWMPYNYDIGNNDPATRGFAWIGGMWTVGMGANATLATNATATPCVLNVTNATSPNGTYQVQSVKDTFSPSDPRSIRFNPTMITSVNRLSPYWGAPLWANTTDPVYQTNGEFGSQAIPSSFVSVSHPYCLAQFSRNNTNVYSGTNTFGYPDPDGVQRIADSGLYPVGTASTAGNPYTLSATRTADRPVILNRPFYSVGELGYASRDYPWRSLDFFTAASADAGLLDLFTVSDSTNTVVAGRVNLNTQNTNVLTAVLNNTIADVVGATSLSNPSQIATNMTSFTATNALLGRDQIATMLVPSLVASDFSTTDNQSIKARREGVSRALADVGQTRTWNLMIDIVAQAGRYPPSASTLDQFMVEGERHYWLHVAIDRFTGQVIDRQLETVTP